MRGMVQTSARSINDLSEAMYIMSWRLNIWLFGMCPVCKLTYDSPYSKCADHDERVAAEFKRQPTQIIHTGQDEHSAWAVSITDAYVLIFNLRWSVDGELQQAWQNQRTGEFEWREIPREVSLESFAVESET